MLTRIEMRTRKRLGSAPSGETRGSDSPASTVRVNGCAPMPTPVTAPPVPRSPALALLPPRRRATGPPAHNPPAVSASRGFRRRISAAGPPNLPGRSSTAHRAPGPALPARTGSGQSGPGSSVCSPSPAAPVPAATRRRSAGGRRSTADGSGRPAGRYPAGERRFLPADWGRSNRRSAPPGWQAAPAARRRGGGSAWGRAMTRTGGAVTGVGVRGSAGACGSAVGSCRQAAQIRVISESTAESAYACESFRVSIRVSIRVGDHRASLSGTCGHGERGG
jgi:hypothetical protein